ncbi:MAG: hypothetical protein Q8M07_00355 [Prosthecobacter sp.]|nr:hypothetical protein [Prosthecobacter sp.]
MNDLTQPGGGKGMRWLFWLMLWGGVSMTTAAKEVSIPCTTWYEGHLTSCEAALVGEVVKVDSHVEQSPSQVLPKESCLIRVDEIIGSSPELQGATTAKLVANHLHDTYQQLEPDWGLYRHLRPGQKVVALIHRYENNVAIGSDALIVLKPETMALPEIIRRTGLDLAFFTADDLAVWQVACPQMFPELADRAAYERKRSEEERRMGDVAPMEWLALLGVVLVVIWVGRKCFHRAKRRTQ